MRAPGLLPDLLPEALLFARDGALSVRRAMAGLCGGLPPALARVAPPAAAAAALAQAAGCVAGLAADAEPSVARAAIGAALRLLLAALGRYAAAPGDAAAREAWGHALVMLRAVCAAGPAHAAVGVRLAAVRLAETAAIAFLSDAAPAAPGVAPGAPMPEKGALLQARRPPAAAAAGCRGSLLLSWQATAE